MDKYVPLTPDPLLLEDSTVYFWRVALIDNGLIWKEELSNILQINAVEDKMYLVNLSQILLRLH